MKFQHRVTVEASKQAVRDFLDDFDRAAMCVPGLEEVKELDEPNTYEGRVRVRIGPLGLNVTGRAKLDKSSDEVWKLQGEGRDRRVGAGVVANVEAVLVELAPERTEVVMDADVQFSGRLAELGQPLIKRKSDSTVKEFAENLKKALEPRR
jgi:carbon monoxide dehydrogenase subunit G